ncbi:MAG: hypothetical protein JXB45_06935 [Candidatus Krumholzibacteriota bacterium]|nr:hypothetical protein [Candidatus Krumholzibacteriota bacterium]
MKNYRLTLCTGLLLGLILLGVIGCSQENSSTAPDVPQLNLSAVAEDPLGDALDSTDGCTPADPTARIDRLAEVLDLSEEQKAALLEAFLEFRAAVTALRDQVIAGEITLREARDQALLLREDFEAELQVILTPEQYDQLEEMRRHRFRNETGECDKYQRWDAWLTEIGADSTQIAAVYEALDILRDGIRDLNSQVQDGTITRREAILAAKALREEFDATLQDILTEEQYEALLALRPDKCRR